ncbi:hypothetical protein RRG08_008820 [Elysia crispata]|uniref:Uncharacterized protein n=1 Tax=Elysia crispata TaxID=231223 RepID=A0AAE0XRN8_9GAST|nr:hypothetical protein RRG08_008820 [Elysia crispata]
MAYLPQDLYVYVRRGGVGRMAYLPQDLYVYVRRGGVGRMAYLPQDLYVYVRRGGVGRMAYLPQDLYVYVRRGGVGRMAYLPQHLYVYVNRGGGGRMAYLPQDYREISTNSSTSHFAAAQLSARTGEREPLLKPAIERSRRLSVECPSTALVQALTAQALDLPASVRVVPHDDCQ